MLVVAPPGPADPKLMSRRMRLWNNQLGCLGRWWLGDYSPTTPANTTVCRVIVINMPPPKGEASTRTPLNNYLYQMVSATLTKVNHTLTIFANNHWSVGKGMQT